MNDDEFFSQFPMTPRPQFVESSRAKFSELVSSREIDGSREGEIMMEAAPLTIAPRPLTQPRTYSRGWPAILMVASILVGLFLGLALVLNANQIETELPLAPVGNPITPIISRENVAQLHHIAQLGKGKVYEAMWSPDGKWLIMPGTTGLWVYDAKDLTSPIAHLYPELSLYSPVIFSGNGRYLAFVNDTRIYMWDLVAWKNIPPNVQE